MTPMDITILLLIFAFAYFLYTGTTYSRVKHNYESYFLAKKEVTSKDNRASYVARFTSLATVLSFFLIFTQYNGIALLFAPITVLIGVVVFVNLFKRHSLPQYHSLDSFVSAVYNSHRLGSLTVIISSFGLVVILLIEIYVGVSVFKLFISDKSSYFPMTVFLISGLVFAYIALGGLSAVIVTDRIQTVMIYFGIAFLLLTLAIITDFSSVRAMPRPLIQVSDEILKSVFILPIPLLLNVLIVNIFLLPSLLSTWQIAAASENSSSFSKGIMTGGVSVLILWSVFILCGLYLAAQGSNFQDITQIFIFLRDNNNVLISYIVFPVLFIGAVAALLSTADSAIIPLVQVIHDKIAQDNGFSITLIRWLLFVGWMLIGALYILVFTILKYNFMSLLFTVFGLSVCISPAVLLALWHPEKVRQANSSGWAIVSVCFGFLTAVTLSFIGSQGKSIELIQLGAPIGFAISAILLLPVFFKKVQKSLDE